MYILHTYIICSKEDLLPNEEEAAPPVSCRPASQAIRVELNHVKQNKGGQFELWLLSCPGGGGGGGGVGCAPAAGRRLA